MRTRGHLDINHSRQWRAVQDKMAARELNKNGWIHLFKSYLTNYSS